MNKYAQEMNRILYGPDSIFTAEEQKAMHRGYTTAERIAISGRMFGIYPQAISLDHAAKLNRINFGPTSTDSIQLTADSNPIHF